MLDKVPLNKQLLTLIASSSKRYNCLQEEEYPILKAEIIYDVLNFSHDHELFDRADNNNIP